MPRSGWLTVLRVAIAIKFAVAQAQDCSDSPDVAQYCSHWAQAGECEKNRVRDMGPHWHRHLSWI